MASSPSSASQQLASRIKWPSKPRSIGRGAFGDVHEAFDQGTACIVAVKQLQLREADGTDISRDKVQNLVAEISLMKKLRHPNIVKYIGAFRTTDHLNIVMEYIAAGSVKGVIRRYGAVLNENVARIYTRDMVRGLAYLHANKVAHRDLKCENLLLCSTGVLKLADFGSSKELVGDLVTTSTLAGTPLFMAPEVALNRGGYDPFLADIWTLGITVIEMIQGAPPFADRFNNPHEAILHVANSEELPPIPRDVSDDCRDFLSKCIVRDPAARWTAHELLNHTFIALGGDDPPRSPEPPGSARLRPTAPPTPRAGGERPLSGGFTSVHPPRPPSSQRGTPGAGEDTLYGSGSRPSSRDPFPGRAMVSRPLSGGRLSLNVASSPKPLQVASPRPHHLPSIGGMDPSESMATVRDDELPRPPLHRRASLPDGA